MTKPLAACLVVALVAFATARPARGQPPLTGSPPATTQGATEKDALGRGSPRGTLIGFMSAGTSGNFEAASLYLNTNLHDEARIALARKLYAVLDSRLPARLNQVSDSPEGSLANPLRPDQDTIGTITTDEGPLDIVVERVSQGAVGRVWLFSGKTLDAVPSAYDEVHVVSVERFLPRWLRPRVGGIRLFQWLAFFLLLPLLYKAVGLLAILVGPLVAIWRRRAGLPDAGAVRVPGSIRLLMLAIAIRWLASMLDLPLFERQFWAAIARLLSTTALVWLGLRLNAYGERYLRRRFQDSSAGDVAGMMRLLRWTADVFVILIGCLVVLRFFDLDPTAALAGVGIGGIAVALAAQKTLENVIGGLSIIFDKAVRVGDTLKLGDVPGTVEHIGLRSTRIRTLDRTVLSVPNGQIATANIETLSERDKFWFHHFVGLTYQTSAQQMRGIVADIRDLLHADMIVEKTTIRARFMRFGAFSIDVEVSAYLSARNWDHFLELQEGFLLEIMEIVERRGSSIAFPSQTVYMSERQKVETPAKGVGPA